MKLLHLSCRNFKRARMVDLRANGGNLNVFGDNGTGKTTLADAYQWLLFGKDSAGRSTFDIKTLDADGLVVPGLEHSVECTFDTGRETLVLTKVYKELWTRERGKTDKEFAGNTTDYFINSVGSTKREFDERVSGLCAERGFRLLTDPTFFATQLKWEERRKILLQICGDVSDGDVIAAKEDLAELPEILGQHSLEDYRKILKQRTEKINEELKVLPSRIDEARRSIPAEAPQNEGDHAVLLQQLRAEQTEKLQQRAQTMAGGAIADKTRQINEIAAKMIALENRLRASANAVRDQVLTQVRAKEQEAAMVEVRLPVLRNRIAHAEGERSRLDPRLVALRQKFADEDAKGFSGSTVCPGCGRALPEDRVQEALANFNQAKARTLADIRSEGQALRTLFDNHGNDVESWKAELAAEEAKVLQIRAERDAIVVPEPGVVDLEGNAEYAELAQSKAAIEAEVEAAKSGLSIDVTLIDTELAEVAGKIQTAERAALLVRHKAEAEARVAQLAAREKELAAQFEEFERHRFLTDLFVKTKVAMLTERINGRFKFTRFKLFDVQVNGAVVECCEATYNGVPYGSLNHGARINCGLDIINVLADHRGFYPPIFIDNAESVTTLLPTRGQQIRLVVDAGAKELRIETPTETAARLEAESLARLAQPAPVESNPAPAAPAEPEAVEEEIGQVPAGALF